MTYSSCSQLKKELSDEANSIVSFQTQIPEALQYAMTGFIDQHPNWDQYRLIQAALAGFLVQNGVKSRSLTRLYVGNMFQHKSLNSEY
tara:strand:+ start:218 stop:481 length:264 start_codon:yes stop_codon:yes gene_type:complete